MIARIWHGVTPKSKADEYAAFLNRTGVKDYQGTPGNQGVQILRRIQGEEAHFLIITLWESVEAIKRFAGEEYEKARYYSDDKDFLLAFEEFVDHYEVVLNASQES